MLKAYGVEKTKHVNKNLLTRYRNQHGKVLACFRCGLDLLPGDVFITSGGSPKRHFYHASCWKGLFF